MLYTFCTISIVRLRVLRILRIVTLNIRTVERNAFLSKQ